MDNDVNPIPKDNKKIDKTTLRDAVLYLSISVVFFVAAFFYFSIVMVVMKFLFYLISIILFGGAATVIYEYICILILKIKNK